MTLLCPLNFVVFKNNPFVRTYQQTLHTLLSSSTRISVSIPLTILLKNTQSSVPVLTLLWAKILQSSGKLECSFCWSYLYKCVWVSHVCPLQSQKHKGLHCTCRAISMGQTAAFHNTIKHVLNSILYQPIKFQQTSESASHVHQLVSYNSFYAHVVFNSLTNNQVTHLFYIIQQISRSHRGNIKQNLPKESRWFFFIWKHSTLASLNEDLSLSCFL